MLVSSMPAPVVKPAAKRNVRRETWCGPAMRKSMARQSFGFHKLLRPLPQTVQQVRQLNESQEDERLVPVVPALAKCEDDSLISVSSEGFDNTPNRYKSFKSYL